MHSNTGFKAWSSAAGESRRDGSRALSAHKFVVGQKVRFTPEMGQTFNRGETFIVVRPLPEAGGVLQYQIKSEMDGHERVVQENQLAKL